MNVQTPIINILISNVEADNATQHNLVEHLSQLKQNNPIRIWHQGMIAAGEERKKKQAEEIQKADLVLMLISSKYLASDDFLELVNLLKNKPKVKIFPILIRACDWQGDAFLKNKRALPLDGIPILGSQQKKTPDESYFEIVQNIKQQISGEKGVIETPAIADHQASPKKNSKTIWYAVFGLLLLGIAGFGYTQFSNFDKDTTTVESGLEEEKTIEVAIVKPEVILETKPSTIPVPKNEKTKPTEKPKQVTNNTPTQTPSKSTPTHAILEVENSTYNFGAIKNNQSHRHVFSIKNVGELPLVITDVYTNDKFLEIKNKSTQIGKGGTGEIEIELNPVGKNGALQGKIFVKANTASPTTTLTISAEVSNDLFTLICNIKAAGVKVWLIDEVSGDKIENISDQNGEIELKIPTNLLNQSVKIRYGKGKLSDSRTVQISKTNCFSLSPKFLEKIKLE